MSIFENLVCREKFSLGVNKATIELSLFFYQDIS